MRSHPARRRGRAWFPASGCARRRRSIPRAIAALLALPPLVVCALLLTQRAGTPRVPPAPTPNSQPATATATAVATAPPPPRAFDGRLGGTVVFTSWGRIRKVTLGESDAIDLGPGTFARWSPDGTAIAVAHEGGIEWMSADGTGRKRLVDSGVNEPACPIEFHPNGREILYCIDGGGLHSVDVREGLVRDWRIPFEREIGISADGKRLAGRCRKDLCATEFPFERLRKYADGCSSGISPDGRWLLSNRGDHVSIALTPFEGGTPNILQAEGLAPDPKWDNQTWSNHPDYLVTQGYGGPGDCYVLEISSGELERVTRDQAAQYPDLHVSDVAPAPVATEITALPRDAGTSDAAWPPHTEGAVFLWENARCTNEVPGAPGRGTQLCHVTASGTARLGPHHDMDLAGGAFEAGGWAGDLAGSEAITIEMSIASAGTPGSIVSLGPDPAHPAIAIEERDGTLHLVAGRTGKRRTPKIDVSLGPLPTGRPQHLTVIAGAKGTFSYIDGERVGAKRDARPDPSAWRKVSLHFGAPPALEHGKGWRGSLAHVALYRRALSPEEIEANAAAARATLGKRREVRQCIVEARLVDRTPFPEATALQDYARGLIWHSYDVCRIVRGELESKTVKVAHWAVLDRTPVQTTASLVPNRIYRLQLQAYDDHPQLESEWNDDRLERFDLPEYYAPSPPVVID